MIKEKSNNLTCPFWSWNGKITKEEIKKQIALFKKMGYGGFFIHPRTGLETEYLSKEWFGLVNYCIKVSNRLGLKVYLYDEDRYPSGTCGGQVTKDKRFAKKYLKMTVCDTFVGEYFDSVVAVFSAEFDGEYLKSYRRYNGEAGKVLVFYIEYGENSSYFNGQPYLDTLNADATNAFLKSTHEKYKKHCGKSFGKDVFAIFSDEVGYGHVFCDNLKNNVTQNKQIPYTYTTFKDFYDRYGYNLEDHLPELFFRKKGQPLRKIAWQYINLLQETFLSNFAKPYSNWCKQNNINYTGHILQEETLSTQTACCGSAMRFYEYMDYPGIDELRENAKNEWKLKQVVSVKKQLNKEHAIAECYGATGYNVMLERYKKMNDVLSAFGITLKVPHMAWYTMKGRIKRDYPSNLFYQTCGYEYEKTLETYFDNLNKYLLSGEDLTDVCVLSPIETVWAMAHSEAFTDDGFGAKDKNIVKFEKQFADTFYALLQANIDFDYADEGLMEKYCSVVVDADGTKLKIGNKKYKAIALYENKILRKTTFDLLKEFADKGGKVFFNNENFQLVDFEKAENFDLNGFIAVNSLADLTEKLKNEQQFKISAHKDLVFNVKKQGEEYFVFVVNLERNENLGEVEICFSEEFNAYEVQLFSDEIVAINSQIVQGKTKITSACAGGQARLFKLTKKEEQVKANEKQNFAELELSNEFDYELSADNILLLDKAGYYVDGKFLGEEYVLSVDNALRNKFTLEQKKELMCQPYYKKKYEPDYDKKLCDLKLEYSFDCEYIPSEIYLAFEQGEDFSVQINGFAVEKKSCGFWVDNCFTKIKIPTEKLIKGKNVLSLTCGYRDAINVESVYLLGKFGVKMPEKIICELPKTLKVGDVTKQGLPFYSDKIIYYIPTEAGKAKVCFNGENAFHQGVIASDKTLTASFYPYETEVFNCDGLIKIELCLSRQNTFGAIHHKDKDLSWYGPFAYVDFKNGTFTKDYVLKEQGLLTKPKIYKI